MYLNGAEARREGGMSVATDVIGNGKLMVF